MSWVVTITNFLPDADSVVDRLMSSPLWQRFEGQNFGESTHDNIVSIDDCISKIEDKLGYRVNWDSGITQGDFRLGMASQNCHRRTLVHFDADYTTGILALSKTVQSGTVFYRHRQTGFVCAREARDYSWIDQEVYKRTWDLDVWEPYMELPHEFNTLYIFDGNYFHSGPQTLKDGRLTQNYWFKKR
ncbi:hypothetical protein EBU99_14480 [bacterium]|nr:hypothetical protein [bacterium]